MITVIVRFKLPANVDAARAADLFLDLAPKYEGLIGLVRKYYLYDAESHIGGGCSSGRIVKQPSVSTMMTGVR